MVSAFTFLRKYSVPVNLKFTLRIAQSAIHLIVGILYILYKCPLSHALDLIITGTLGYEMCIYCFLRMTAIGIVMSKTPAFDYHTNRRNFFSNPA